MFNENLASNAWFENVDWNLVAQVTVKLQLYKMLRYRRGAVSLMRDTLNMLEDAGDLESTRLPSGIALCCLAHAVHDRWANEAGLPDLRS